jgi:GNAT superfamily N-acetyltransferase
VTDTQQASAVDVKLSSVAEIREHGEELLRAHTQEAEPDLAPYYAPAWEAYEEAERRGDLLVLAAWHDGAELVGYAVAAVVQSMHYSGVRLCQHDLLYVAPAHRGRGLGKRLVEALRLRAKQWGAQRLLLHAKPGSTLWNMLMLHGGFRVEETIFVRDL